MAEQVEENNASTVVIDESLPQEGNVDKLMKDSAKRSEILRKLGFPANPSILTPGGKTIGGGGCLPPIWCPFPMFPPWIPGSAPGPSSSTGEQPQGSSQEAMEDSAVAYGESYFEEDVVEPLDNAAALEFVEFDPMVDFPAAGRVACCLHSWEKITSDPWVLGVVKGDFRSSLHRRAEMVEHPVAHMEWQRCPSTGSRYGTQLHTWNGRDVHPWVPDMVLETDASLLGWGAVCNGTCTGGLWSPQERTLHINQLELLAGSFAVQTFAKDRRDIHIHLRMDNNTARCYVSQMGGTHSPSLMRQACQL